MKLSKNIKRNTEGIIVMMKGKLKFILNCHPERSEGSSLRDMSPICKAEKILRYVQDDKELRLINFFQ